MIMLIDYLFKDELVQIHSQPAHISKQADLISRQFKYVQLLLVIVIHTCIVVFHERLSDKVADDNC